MTKTTKFFLLFACCLNASTYADETSLCKASEVIIASCHLDEAKDRTISFCANENNNTVSYRFGSTSNLEINIQFSPKKPVNRWLDVATYTTYFGFRRASYSYVFGVPQESLGARAFLDILKNDKVIVSLDCKDNSHGEKNIDSESIKNVPDASVRNNDFLFPPY